MIEKIDKETIVILSDTDKPRFYYSTCSNPYSWKEPTGGSIWFPFAERFMRRFPRVAVRVFYLIIITRNFWRKFWRIDMRNCETHTKVKAPGLCPVCLINDNKRLREVLENLISGYDLLLEKDEMAFLQALIHWIVPAKKVLKGD